MPRGFINPTSTSGALPMPQPKNHNGNFAHELLDIHAPFGEACRALDEAECGNDTGAIEIITHSLNLVIAEAQDAKRKLNSSGLPRGGKQLHITTEPHPTRFWAAAIQKQRRILSERVIAS